MQKNLKEIHLIEMVGIKAELGKAVKKLDKRKMGNDTRRSITFWPKEEQHDYKEVRIF